MIGRLPLNGWFHDRMIWLPTGMAVSVGANGALFTRIKSTSDRVSESGIVSFPSIEIPSGSDTNSFSATLRMLVRVATSSNETDSDNEIKLAADLEILSVRDRDSDSEMPASLERLSVNEMDSESKTEVDPSRDK